MINSTVAVVRVVRTLMGQGERYPKDPRQFGVAVNQHVHVNEQSMMSLGRALRQAGFQGKVWLDSPPHRRIMLRPDYREVGIGVVQGAPKATSSGLPGATYVLNLGVIR